MSAAKLQASVEYTRQEISKQLKTIKFKIDAEKVPLILADNVTTNRAASVHRARNTLLLTAGVLIRSEKHSSYQYTKVR